jgi:hypothetical protein
VSIAPARPRAPIGPSRAVPRARAHDVFARAHTRNTLSCAWSVAGRRLGGRALHAKLHAVRVPGSPAHICAGPAAETPHICAGTRPHLRKDFPTSAPGLCRYSQIPGVNLFDTKGAPPIKTSHTQTCHICTGTGLPPLTSAPGLGSSSPHLHRDWGSSLPHLHLDWARPFHVCTGTGLILAASARGLGSPHSTSARDWTHPIPC